MRTKKTAEYTWKFANYASVPQALITTGSDIANLKNLDIKLWTVLAMPVRGIHVDSRTLLYLDSDGDAFVRPPELLNAIDWMVSVLTDPDILVSAGDDIPIESIRDKDLAFSARWLLNHIDKHTAKSISVSDVYLQKKNLETESSIDADDPLQALVQCAIQAGSANDALAVIQKAAQNVQTWYNELVSKPDSIPLGLDGTQAAFLAMSDVRKKIDDYFVRCALGIYQPAAKSALSPDADIFKPRVCETLSRTSECLAALPLSTIRDDAVLVLDNGINPAWREAVRNFLEKTVWPLEGKNTNSITEESWKRITEKLAAYEAWYNAKPDTILAAPDKTYAESLLTKEKKEALEAIIQRYTLFETERSRINQLEKLLLFRRDLHTILKNYVSFTDFYEGRGAAFQAGVLYFDARAAVLCFELTEDARHVSLDGLSGAFLMYCDLVRGGEKKKVLALFTDGESGNIVVGRNGIFYDRDGNDWNATVTKITQNPMSMREAFFMPYRKLASMIEAQIAKRAQAAEDASTAKLSGVAEKVSTIEKEETQKAGIVPPPKKLDLGTIALIGTALGGISALIGSILQALFGLGYWVPLGIAAVLLCISGPSMVLTSLKLRKRSIGSILDANGWAVNKRIRINIPFGKTLTHMAALPLRSMRTTFDPFAEKKAGKKIFAWTIVFLAALASVFCYFYFWKKAGWNPLQWL